MSDGVAGIEGRLAIRLVTRGAPGRGEVEIESTRPLRAARVFEGRSIDETLKLMPLLFSICGQAQALAAVRAIESAQGVSVSADVERRRDRLKSLETLREHLWRVLLDAPLYWRGPAERGLMTRLVAEIEALKALLDPRKELLKRPGLDHDLDSSASFEQRWVTLRTAIEREVFGCALGDWLGGDVTALFAWADATDTVAAALLRWVREQGWEGLGRSRVAVMPDLPGTELAERLDDAGADRFIAVPDWHGEPLETGPVARLGGDPLLTELAEHNGNGLLTRLVARLIEIARITLELPGPPAQQGARPGPAVPSGLCQLEAARGRLVHRVELDGDRVRRYRILAPTEWNFHPAGVAAQALSTVTADAPGAARTQARLLIYAVDPCVGYSLDLGLDVGAG